MSEPIKSKKIKFCVITTPRSGSTWLKHLLDNHPEIKMFGEPFLWRKVKKGWSDEVFLRYYDYCQSSSSLRPWRIFKYLDILDNYQSEPHSAIGFKIMYKQIVQNPEFLLKIIADKYRIIHLARRNHLDVLISLTVARQHNIFHVKDSSSKTRAVNLDTSSLIRTLDIYEMSYKATQTLLKYSPLTVLEIDYDSLKNDREKTLTAIADFLQVDRNSIVLETQHQKVNPGSYANKIENYDRVCEVLKGSKYAHFLNT